MGPSSGAMSSSSCSTTRIGEILRWSLREAWIARIEVSELDASKNEVAIETIELAHEGLELVT